jgi:hypothetical protein
MGDSCPKIPSKYVCDIKSGEFFELAKLLPKNLNKLNVGSDYSDNVGFTISPTVISLTPCKPQVLTNIKEWTVGNCYCAVDQEWVTLNACYMRPHLVSCSPVPWLGLPNVLLLIEVELQAFAGQHLGC